MFYFLIIWNLTGSNHDSIVWATLHVEMVDDGRGESGVRAVSSNLGRFGNTIGGAGVCSGVEVELSSEK